HSTAKTTRLTASARTRTSRSFDLPARTDARDGESLRRRPLALRGSVLREASDRDEKAASELADEGSLLVEPPGIDRDDACVGTGARATHLDDGAFAVERVAVMERSDVAQLLSAQRGDRSPGRVGHAHPE